MRELWGVTRALVVTHLLQDLRRPVPIEKGIWHPCRQLPVRAAVDVSAAVSEIPFPAEVIITAALSEVRSPTEAGQLSTG